MERMVLTSILIIVALASSSSGVVMQCSFFQYIIWNDVSQVYTCWYARVTNYNDEATVTNITGNHIIGKTNADVEGFVIYLEPNLSRIPRGIENFFPNLIGLAWGNTNLTSLVADDLKPFPKLLSAWFPSNKFVSLHSDLFVHTPMVRHIDFGRNLLENVGSDLLTSLNNLTSALFNDNRCISFNANTSQSIQNLIAMLREQCPEPETTTAIPTTTTLSTTTVDPEECPVGCSEKIELLQEKFRSEIFELREANERQEAINRYLQEANGELRELLDAQANRIEELEKQMREILLRP